MRCFLLDGNLLSFADNDICCARSKSPATEAAVAGRQPCPAIRADARYIFLSGSASWVTNSALQHYNRQVYEVELWPRTAIPLLEFTRFVV